MNRAALRTMQEDAYGRVLAHAYLSDVATILERRAYTAKEIEQRLSVRKGRSGKIGTCILVQMPVVNTPQPDSVQLRLAVIQAFTVLEHPTLNAGSIGTGKSAEEISVELVDLFHFASYSGAEQVARAAPATIVPDLSFEGLVGYEVRIVTFIDLDQPLRAGLPLIDPDEGAHPQSVTLTSGTAGADLWYTTDGSYPSSQDATALKYAGTPLAIAAACKLRAAAEKSGLQPSSVAEAIFT